MKTVMKTVRVEILNPKAAKLLKDLEELNLIAIKGDSNGDFARLLKKLRSKAKSAPTLSEITKEVELAREQRYVRKG